MFSPPLCLFAVCVLKQFEEETERETKGFITVLAASCPPDPVCISLKTLPLLPGMMASSVCKYSIFDVGYPQSSSKKVLMTC